MKCQSCGTEYEGNFCPNCGTPAAIKEASDNCVPTEYSANDYTQNDYASVNYSDYNYSQSSNMRDGSYNQAGFQPPMKIKKPFYKKWWFWILIVIAVVVMEGVIGCVIEKEENNPNTGVLDMTVESSEKPEVSSKLEESSKSEGIGAPKTVERTDEISEPEASSETEESWEIRIKVKVADFSTMDKDSIKEWAKKNNVTCKISEEYSDSVKKGKMISQSEKTDSTVYEGDTVEIIFSKGKKPPKEYSNALKKAETYSDLMHMSKQAIFDQLTSEYGEQFPEDAAQYAIDNLDVDWKDNALKNAESYSDTMHMSKQRIYDQLISEYGEQFTEKEAQYAIDHIKADWNKNALEKAKSYQDSLNMSVDAIYDQLISEYGERFTEEEAQYAIDHLDD